MTDCNCKYKFRKWLINKALKNKPLYWLLWGFLVVLGICAYKFGLAWL